MITPDISATYVAEFCRGISTEPVFYVPVEPRPGLTRGNCFNNVDEVIAAYGGRSVYGWNIAEWPGVFIEAEQHAIWQRPDDSFVDPTPPVFPFTRIAFLPDSSLGEWEFRLNVNKPLIQDRLITDYLETARLAQRDQKRNGFIPAPLARRVRSLHGRMMERYGTRSSNVSVAHGS